MEKKKKQKGAKQKPPSQFGAMRRPRQHHPLSKMKSINTKAHQQHKNTKAGKKVKNWNMF